VPGAAARASHALPAVSASTPDAGAIREAKAALREEALAARIALDPEARRVLSLAIAERVARLPEFRAAAVVHAYVGARDGEVETRDLIARALRAGRRVICTRVVRHPRALEHYEITGLDELAPSAGGLWEPDPARCRRADPAEARVVLVPGLAFDRAGGRVGYGAGYYDRFLAGLRATTVGLAYSLQLRDAVPREPHDVTLDLVITELETIDVRARPA